MITSTRVSRKQDSNSSWEALYNLLRPRVKRLAYSYSSSVSAWLGQESDIAEDHLQETVLRLWEHDQRAKRGETRPINSSAGMGMKIARNYSIDRSRQDRRLVRIEHNNRSSEITLPVVRYSQADPAEVVIEKVFEESLLVLLPPEIVKFPPKLRRALLIDLANLMDFGEHPTPVQQAFLDVGIQMLDYQLPLPDNPVERCRHSSLLSLAYKRVRELPCVKWYISAA